MKILRGVALLLTVVVWIPPTHAHHSTAALFDTGKVIALDGTIVEVQWINPHLLLSMRVKGSGGADEVWLLQGAGPNLATREGLKREDLKVGAHILAFAHPPRRALVLERNAVTAAAASTSDAEKPAAIAEAGEIRFDDGQTRAFGRGPAFTDLP